MNHKIDDDNDNDDSYVMDSDAGSSNDSSFEKNEESTSSIIAKLRAREQLNADVEAFLNGGGRVTVVDDNVRADPPRRPALSYGSNPI